MGVRRLLEAPLRRGRPDRMPIDLAQEAEKGVGKYARWFYRNRVCQESPYAIAQAYHLQRPDHRQEFPHCGCYKDVRYGLRQAERLLNLAP